MVVVGVGGGILTSSVGGASVLTFPALVVIRLPPVPAVVVNRVASMPGNFASAWWDRTHLPAFSAYMLALRAVSGIGGIAGALLLLITPAAVSSR